MNEKKFALKDSIRSRCKIIELSEKERKRFTAISLELFHYLKELDRIDFSLFFRIESEMVEFITPKELSEKLLDGLFAASNQKNADIEVCILKADQAKFEQAIDSVRNKKIKAVLEQDPTLDGKSLEIYSSLSSASQMILRGGITNTVANRALDAAASLMQSQLDNHVAVGTISRMINCDSTLYDHSASVAMFSGIVAQMILSKKIEKKDINIVTQCGLYHDTGKSCVPNDILNKPGKFTPEEFEIMKTHVDHGHAELSRAIAKGAPISELAARVALEHHERFQGGGYPNGRKGRFEEDPERGIHLYSRVVAIADVYSALLMKRVYKDSMSSSEAIEIMRNCAERDFDPDLFEPFYEVISETQKVFRQREIEHKKAQIRMIGDKESFSQAYKDIRKKEAAKK